MSKTSGLEQSWHFLRTKQEEKVKERQKKLLKSVSSLKPCFLVPLIITP